MRATKDKNPKIFARGQEASRGQPTEVRKRPRVTLVGQSGRARGKK